MSATPGALGLDGFNRLADGALAGAHPLRFDTQRISLGEASSQYGKAENRVLREYRDTTRREIHDINVSTCLRGDFSAANLTGAPVRCSSHRHPEATTYAYAKEITVDGDGEWVVHGLYTVLEPTLTG